MHHNLHSVCKKKRQILTIGSIYIYVYIYSHTHVHSNIFSYNFLLMWQHDEHFEEAEPSENTTCRTGHV